MLNNVILVGRVVEDPELKVLVCSVLRTESENEPSGEAAHQAEPDQGGARPRQIRRTALCGNQPQAV